MFSASITSQTPVWGDTPNLFPHIVSTGTVDDDQSIVIALRVLLEPRLDKNDPRTFTYRETYRVNDRIKNEYTFNLVDQNSLTTSDTDHIAGLQNQGWSRLKDIEDFIKKQIDYSTTILVNEDINSVVIVGTANSKLKHALAFFVPRYYRSFFADRRPDAHEMEVLNGLLGATSYRFLAALDSLADDRGLKAIVSAQKVADASKIFMEASVQTAESEYMSAKRYADNAFETYKSSLKDRDDKLIYLEGLRAKLESGENETSKELYDFILENKHIRVIDVGRNGVIELMINNYLDIYDADGFEVFGDGFFERVAIDVGWSKDDTELLLRSIFSAEPKFRTRICAYYRLNISGHCSTEAGYSYSEVDRIPNPHLYRHGCLGQNEGEINNCLRNGNIVGAIMQCNASAMSVNVHETNATFRPFCHDLILNRGKILELPDGKRLTAKEALEYLKQEGQAQ